MMALSIRSLIRGELFRERLCTPQIVLHVTGLILKGRRTGGSGLIMAAYLPLPMIKLGIRGTTLTGC